MHVGVEKPTSRWRGSHIGSKPVGTESQKPRFASDMIARHPLSERQFTSPILVSSMTSL